MTEHWAYRGLVLAFARRDFSTRYRTSLIGWAWSLIQPFVMLGVFTFVLGSILPISAPDLGAHPGNSSYAAYILIGIMGWNVFSGILNLSLSQLLSSADLRRKVRFPAWTPIIGASLVLITQTAIEFSVVCLLLLLLPNVPWTWLLAPVIVLAFVMFSQGIGLMVSAWNAHWRDVEHGLVVVLGLLYFLTPVIYPLSALEGHDGVLATVVTYNPLSWYIDALHAVFYTLSPPTLGSLGILMIGGLASLTFGFWIFNSSTRDLAELL